MLTLETLSETSISWLPSGRAFSFIADPFGIEHEGDFTIFVEALDYRVKRGEIRYYTYNKSWSLIGQGLALRKRHHLSYPQIIRDGDAIYMLPEAHRSGKLTLYRAKKFPKKWEPVADFSFPAIDASVIHYQGRWWMFYALPGPDGRAMRELHVAYADSLTGPWNHHTNNPVRTGLDSSRPGGTPFEHDGALYLPTQNCVGGYGMGITLLRIDELSPEGFGATIVNSLTPSGIHPDFTAGLHTLSSVGKATLIDVKRVHRSQRRILINMERRLRRLIGLS